VTRNEWVAAALDAAVEQVGQVGIEDPATLDLIAGVLLRAENTEKERVPERD
jgi:hypothetical protein